MIQACLSSSKHETLVSLSKADMEQRSLHLQWQLRSGAIFPGITFKGKVITLSGTEKSQVYQTWSPEKGKVVIKSFKFATSFHAESAGYLLSSGGPVPRLIARNGELKLLLMRYVEGEQFCVSRHFIGSLAHALGSMHKKLQENISLFLASRYLKNLPKLDYHPYILRQYATVYGADFHFACIGDLQPGHVISNNSKTLTFLDLETFRIGMMQVHDIISLNRFYKKRSDYYRDIELISKCYLNGLEREPSKLQNLKDLILTLSSALKI